jgi:hypothetical protein
MKLESKNNLSHKKAQKPDNNRRAGERGAALITTLLVSVLLLGAGGALIMTTMTGRGWRIDHDHHDVGDELVELDARDAGVLHSRVGNAVSAQRAARKRETFSYSN